MSTRLTGFLLFLPIALLSSSCMSEYVAYAETSTPTLTVTVVPTRTALSTPDIQEVPVTGQMKKPAEIVPLPGMVVYDVTSSGTAAPYGDSYDLNRLERPFLQDMGYVPDLDIVTFSISEDPDWYYVSIQLNGNNPNNPLGIYYGVELDLNADGYGDMLVRAYPPYSSEWTTNWVQVYNDSNHDSAGGSSAKADTGANGNGYETLIFDGRYGEGTDPSLAWVRVQEAPRAVVQFAFKKALSGPVFLVGVVADGGLKDITRFDYNDHLEESEAGSPLLNSSDYPLKALFAVDNTCWQAVGMKNPDTIAKACPPGSPAGAAAPGQSPPPPVADTPPAGRPTVAPPPSYP